MYVLLHTLTLSLLFPFFFFISVAAQSNDSGYPSCPLYRCGNINISYPFWRIGSETSTQFCGYPGFGINCPYVGEHSFASITLENDSYFIRNIIYERESIVLIDDDVSNAVSVPDCPRVRNNISIGTLPFVFPDQNVNLSVHFNCNGVPSFAREIPCLSSPTNKSCVNRVNSEPPDFSWDEFSCDKDVVVTTVLELYAPQSTLGKAFIGALREGFELSWESMADCEKCEESRGRCGFNKNTTEIMCFCSDGTSTFEHCKGNHIYQLSFLGKRTFFLLWTPSIPTCREDIVTTIQIMNTTFGVIRINQNNNNISLAFDDLWVDEPSTSSLELRAYSDADCDNYMYDIKSTTLMEIC
ncbi:hypothetical protein LXL04_020182 [Taraxacum kok-saghyz]